MYYFKTIFYRKNNFHIPIKIRVIFFLENLPIKKNELTKLNIVVKPIQNAFGLKSKMYQ